jgi:hypothetical protein
MRMPSDPLQLLDDYNDYLVRTAHWRKLPRASRRRATPANLKVMRELTEWCEAREIEPPIWIYSLFSARYWTFAPPFKQLRSEKHLAKFRGQKQRGSTFFTNRVQKELNEAGAAGAYDPNRDISGTTENLKRSYLSCGMQQVCMSEVNATLGYHPRSGVCAGCSIARECAAQLQAQMPFDIMALRRGEITAEHAQAQAMLHGPRA